MRILLDESVPQKLRLHLENHTVVTVSFQGWSGLKNGALLAAAEAAGFDLFVTADQEIRFQQNLAGRSLAVLVLSTNNRERLKAGAQQIVTAISAVVPGSYTEVPIPE